MKLLRCWMWTGNVAGAAICLVGYVALRHWLAAEKGAAQLLSLASDSVPVALIGAAAYVVFRVILVVLLPPLIALALWHRFSDGMSCSER